ncbi:hypothetical protein PR202_gb12089 [Eleusine coracana subsp. coracana]|uniref:F-box protein AT5G49610-like beta-propeller domain-containing protein n=1 Tax=Eleusine coracana subsp. coracana TaxID=191504 RepID=A0AAV5EPK4_ELECO|nr:hypothetical protein PR202_gb12089 [Eleusine coracana subsp. coracana]
MGKLIASPDRLRYRCRRNQEMHDQQGQRNVRAGFQTILSGLDCGLDNIPRPLYGPVWDLPEPPFPRFYTWKAAVLCDAYGTCDHLNCHGGPFLVAAVEKWKNRVHVYSSETGSWSERTYDDTALTQVKSVPAALVVRNALYFLSYTNSILKYELATRNMSVIQPSPDFIGDRAVLTTVEDGGLGLARLENSRLDLWSMEFDKGLFSIDLKSHQARKVCNMACGEGGIRTIVPYMSFYTPALRMVSTRDRPNGATSGA